MFCNQIDLKFSRRDFFARAGLGLAGMALTELLHRDCSAATLANGILGQPHLPAKAKRVIYLFMAGGPSQLDLFDYKPGLKERFNQDLPESVRRGKRLSTMTSGQGKFPIAPSVFEFAQHGQ